MDDEAAVIAVLAQHESFFRAGEFLSIAESYRNPVAVFLPDGVLVEQTLLDTVHAIERLSVTARRRGVVQARHSVIGSTRAAPGRMIVHVAWDFLDAAGKSVRQSELRYFFSRQEDGAWLIEMLEYVRLAFPDTGASEPPTLKH